MESPRKEKVMKWFGKKKEEPKGMATNENQNPVNLELIVPEPTVTKNDYHGNPFDHSEFNTIMEFDNAMYRITSQNSREVVRLNCVTKKYDFADALGEDGSDWVYVKSINENRWCKKLYITDVGRFFWQCIYNDDSVKYFPVSRIEMQKELRTWEDPNAMSKMAFHDNSNNGAWIIKPGTYKNSKSMFSDKYHWKWETFYESYEIINKELYDTKLIEIF